MSREHLSNSTRSTTLAGYDNPALDVEKRISGYNNGNSGIKTVNSGLSSVFVLDQKNQAPDKDYDPYEHRDVSHPTTYWETLIHMLKASLGTGILAMPLAFKNAGYIVGTIATIIIGLFCTYTIHILIQSEYILCKRKRKPFMTYPETAQAAVSEGPMAIRKIARAVPAICNVFLLFYQLGSCSIYVVFIATNIKDVIDSNSSSPIDVRICMAAILIPLIFINWIRNLKYLAPLSSIANVVTLVSFCIIFYYMFTDVPSMNTIRPVADIKTMPLFFGTVLFAMEAIGVVMPLENEMKEPKKFGSVFGVLNCAMIPITLLYTFVGFFGYLRYGNTVKGSITLDLPNTIYAQCVKILLSLAIYVTHALACYVAYDICWREFVSPHIKKNRLLAEFSLRTFLVFITFIFAVAVPDLELFISLVGALCLSTMGLAFPALIQLFTHWYDLNGIQFVLFFLKNLAIILIACFGFVIGTYTSVEGIRDMILGHHKPA